MITDFIPPWAVPLLAGWPMVVVFLILFRINFHWKRPQQVTKRDDPDKLGEMLRSEKRSRRRNEAADWDHQYQALLPPSPPPPPCTSTEHDHEELRNWGGDVIRRTCVPTPEWSEIVGRIIAVEAPVRKRR